MKESLIKYLAGLLDADGSLSFTFRQYEQQDKYHIGLVMSLASSDAVDQKNWIETLSTETNMGNVFRYGNTNQFKSWRVNKHSDLEMLLPRLIKHMVIKAQHWQWLLDTWRKLRSEATNVTLIERQTLTELSKQSRKLRVGPIKVKNHPTWAWLAGYLDGDGWYSYRKWYDKRMNCEQWIINMGAAAYIDDVSVLNFIHNAFGGNIFNHNKSGTIKTWRLSLGARNTSAALSILPNLVKHSRLKRDKIQAIIHHHRQRLSVSGPKG